MGGRTAHRPLSPKMHLFTLGLANSPRFEGLQGAYKNGNQPHRREGEETLQRREDIRRLQFADIRRLKTED
jgi:hypothetical protein